MDNILHGGERCRKFVEFATSCEIRMAAEQLWVDEITQADQSNPLGGWVATQEDELPSIAPINWEIGEF